MTDSILQKIYDPEQFRVQGHFLIDLLSDYLSKAMKGEGQQVYPGIGPSKMLEVWKEFDSQNPDIKELFQKTLEHSILLHHPAYIGHQVVPPAPVAALFDLMAALLNNGMAVYEMGPASTAIERIVVESLCVWMDMPPGSGGFLTSGGSLGNLTALLTARKHKVSHIQSAIPGILVSEQAHYSISRAAHIMGLGSDSVIKVPVNQDFAIDVRQLDQVYSASIEKGIQPFVIVGSACTTSSGSYDPLDALADFARKHSLWFHVDGAHGAIANMIPDYKYLVKGINRADSIVVDFHKMFMVPALVTAVLYRDEAQSFATFSQDAEYLLQSHELGEWYNSGNRTLECTKIMMGLKAYSLIALYGKQAFVDFGSTTFSLARELASLIEADPDFELAMAPQSNIVCFRLKGVDDRSHSRIREVLLGEGNFYIVQTKLRGATWFRATLMNPFSNTTQFAGLLKQLKVISDSIDA